MGELWSDPEVFATILRQESQLTELPKRYHVLGTERSTPRGQDPDQLAKNSRLTPLAIDYLQDLRRAGDLERGGIMNENALKREIVEIGKRLFQRSLWPRMMEIEV